jgi:hypothetical protein
LAGGSGIRISTTRFEGKHFSANVLGDYTKQRTEGGRPTYKGGVGGKQAVWYSSEKGKWLVGNASSIGTGAGSMFAIAPTAATPDAVLEGQWMTSGSASAFVIIEYDSIRRCFMGTDLSEWKLILLYVYRTIYIYILVFEPTPALASSICTYFCVPSLLLKSTIPRQ